MAQRRTPVHWPRMKVRGHRNRAKVAARIVTAGRIPYARVIPTGAGYQFVALGGPEPGAVSVNYRSVVDGFGRRVAERPIDPPALIEPAKVGATTWSFSAKLVGGDTSALWDLLVGKDRDALVQG